MTTVSIGTGITRATPIVGGLTFDSAGTHVRLTGLTVHQCDRLAEAALEAREHLLDGLEDVCKCNGGDLPLFDHARQCPRRLLAEYREVSA